MENQFKTNENYFNDIDEKLLDNLQDNGYGSR